MDLGQVASVLVGGPATRPGTSFQKLDGYFFNEWNDYAGRVRQGSQYGSGILHGYFQLALVNLEAITLATVAPSPQAPLIVGALGLATSPIANTAVTDVSPSLLTLI